MSDDDEAHDDEDDPAPDRFALSEKELKLLARFAADLRRSLEHGDPQFIRSAATAIFVIERLPKPTPGAQVDVGYRTSNSGGNYGWTDLVISEEEIRASVGEHFYDPGAGGDTQTHVYFEAGLGEGCRQGDLAAWFEQALELAALYAPYVDDESEDIDWNIGDYDEES
jgi:hypothetical protein